MITTAEGPAQTLPIIATLRLYSALGFNIICINVSRLGHGPKYYLSIAIFTNGIVDPKFQIKICWDFVTASFIHRKIRLVQVFYRSKLCLKIEQVLDHLSPQLVVCCCYFNIFTTSRAKMRQHPMRCSALDETFSHLLKSQYLAQKEWSADLFKLVGFFLQLVRYVIERILAQDPLNP